jgi:hypothetical protein
MCNALNVYLRNLHLDIQLSFDEIKKTKTKGMVRERHIAKVLREKVYEAEVDAASQLRLLKKILNISLDDLDLGNHATVENTIRNYLLKSGGAAYIPESPQMFINLEDIKEIILKSGGIPTYPLLADSVNGGFTSFEKDKYKLLEWLKSKGIFSIEFISNRNSSEVLVEYAKFFVENNFLVTIGSEHNTPELIPIKLTDKKKNDLEPVLKEYNYSGACLIAAHQYLFGRTGQGILDDKGTLKQDKLKYFWSLGSHLLEYYYANNSANYDTD